MHLLEYKSGTYILNKCNLRKLFKEISKIEYSLLLTKKELKLEFKDDLLEKYITKESSNFMDTFNLYRVEYYKDHFNITSEKEIKKLCMEYFTGLTFVIRYYLLGIPSWTYSYNRYRPPLFIDMKRYILKFNENIVFEKSYPPDPIEQLLCVLPKKSIKFLPEELHTLITDEKSVIKEYYPEKFDIKYYGCMKEYEGVPLIPFVEPDKIHKIYKIFSRGKKFKIRNMIGKVMYY